MNLKPIPGAKANAGDQKKKDDADLETQKERAFVVEAFIVKNMKARKTENYPVLLNLVVGQIKMFKCEPTIVKQRIEKLIDREYLERDLNDKKILKYLP